MSKILLVDDDKHIREVARYALERAGYVVTEAKNGIEALSVIATDPPSLIVLDIVMPDEDGLSVCRKVRSTSRLPIIFLSSRDDELDRVIGLELGADDYVSKPFSPRELVARVAAVLRRTSPETKVDDRVISHGPLQVDLGKHRCLWNSTELTFTVTEFALLSALLSSPGRVFEREQLVEKIHGDGYYITDRTVDSHIRRLRKKFSTLGADPIETVYGVGYRLREFE